MLQEAKHTYRMDEQPHEVRPWRCSIHDYLAMAEAGILQENSQVELIDGELFQLPANYAPHEFWKSRLLSILFRAAFSDMLVLVEPSVRFGDDVFMPDILVVPSKIWPARERVIPALTANDSLLLVEVADSSFAHDRVQKAAAYARHGIAEYWVLDAKETKLVVHRGPLPSGEWREVRVLGAEEEIIPLRFSAMRLRLADLG